MLKLLLCLFAVFSTAIVALQLRQQQVNLKLQANRLHNQIEASQSELWNQQLRIAICTSPDALDRAVRNGHIKFVNPAMVKPVVDTHPAATHR